MSDLSSLFLSAVSHSRQRYRVFFHFLLSLPHRFPSISYSVGLVYSQTSEHARCNISDGGVAVLCTFYFQSWEKKQKKVRTDNRCNQSTVMSCAAV